MVVPSVLRKKASVLRSSVIFAQTLSTSLARNSKTLCFPYQAALKIGVSPSKFLKLSNSGALLSISRAALVALLEVAASRSIVFPAAF